MKKLLVLFLLTAVSISAQEVDLSYYLPKNVSYNSNIPTPKSIIGHEVGQWHVTHDKLVTYMKALAKASDRITIENRGTTFEGRPLLLLTITSPKNHKILIKLDKITSTQLTIRQLTFLELRLLFIKGFLYTETNQVVPMLVLQWLII